MEGFCGSAAFFFHVKAPKALLNDTNVELISALRALKEEPELLHTELQELPPSSATYYQFRNADPACLTPIERAVRFFYLNRYCFNGIYRTNKAGKFNVPYSAERTGGFPSLKDWNRCAAQLRSAELYSLDFEVFAATNVVRGDFIYLDPPYAVSNRRVFSQYSANSFGLNDMRRLRALLGDIDASGAKFLVSYAQSPEAKMLSQGWFVSREFAQRNVAGFATHRRRALEVLISNFDPNGVV